MSPEITRRAADGRVYLRVAKKQLTSETNPESDLLFHWCNTESPELLRADTPQHVCDIWAIAANQEYTEPEAPKKTEPPTLGELIARVMVSQVMYSQEDIGLELRHAEVLGVLYQAEALTKVASTLEEIQSRLQIMEHHLERISDNRRVVLLNEPVA